MNELTYALEVTVTSLSKLI